MESVGQSSRLEMQVRIDGTVLRQTCFFFQKPQSLLLRSSTHWVSPTHIMEGNLLYSLLLIVNVNHTEAISSQRHLDCMTKQLGTLA